MVQHEPGNEMSNVLQFKPRSVPDVEAAPTEPKAVEVLACPFCNSVNLVCAYSVLCVDCGAAGPKSQLVRALSDEAMKVAAIELWNLRGGSVHG
jgi:hypothetical protein